MEIKFENVSFIVNRDTPLEKTILNNVNFTIKETAVYGFLGNSNSGKTCIAELCNALIYPTTGKVIVNNFVNNGKRIRNIQALRMSVGYVFKNPYEMFFKKTVRKEIEFGMRYFKYKVKEIDKRIMNALKLVGLNENCLQKDPVNLSLNEAKKVSIACIIAFNPKIIILDEPTIGLDYNDKKHLLSLIRIMKEKYNRIVIIMTKDTDFLYKISDYVFILDKSRLIISGNRDIFNEIALFETLGLKVPDIVKFVNTANSKKEKSLCYYKDIKDLIKGVCRDVF